MLPKIGPRRKTKRALARTCFLFHQLSAGDVARHQVGRELHARVGEIERARNRLHEQRFLRDRERR